MNADKLKKIESYKDIELEKERLKYTISLSEERINNLFKSLAGKFTIEHLAEKIESSFLTSSFRFLRIVRWAYKLFSPKTKNEEQRAKRK